MEGKGLQKIEKRVFSDWSLYHYAVSFFVSWTFFILKSILSDMSIATPAFFWFPFAWNTFFHPLTFTLYVSLDLKWVFCRHLIYGSWFCIPSGSLCLLVGALSVQFSCSVVSDSLWPYEPQHARPPYPSPTLEFTQTHVHQVRDPAISSSAIPFFSCPQPLPTSGSFPMSQLFAWGGQSIGVSASASVLPMNTQDWSHLGWTGWISLQSKGLSRVFSNTIVQKYQFFSAFFTVQLSLHTWPLQKP